MCYIKIFKTKSKDYIFFFFPESAHQNLKYNKLMKIEIFQNLIILTFLKYCLVVFYVFLLFRIFYLLRNL